MNQAKNTSFNPDYSSELNIESIISAPLIAASKANVVMVTGQTRFLLDYCFAKKENSSTYEPVMIDMVMKQGVIDASKQPGDPDYIKKAEMIFSVPLLCLVPLNSLAIDKVTVDFDMEITSMTSYAIEDPGVERGKVMDKKAQLNGKICNKQNEEKSSGSGQYKSQSSSRLVVNINAGPLPLPVGVLTIIDLYTKSIQPLPSPKK
ncbi:MAG: DUF2589 domain-containing protein [Parabacteroides sp.]